MSAVQVRDATAWQLDRALAQEQVDARAPSLAAGVVRDGALVWSGIRGDVPDVAGAVPDVTSTQYRIGSITKTMTTVLVLQLRDEGAVSLDDRLGEHLESVPYADRTLRELLSHSSGLPAEPSGSWWERSPGVDWSTLAGRSADQVAVLPRGLRYHYSNLAYGLLGRLVAELRGVTWRRVLEDRLLAPLGMTQTSYDPGPRAAQGYSVHPWSGALTPEPHQDTGAMAPAGQVWSTVPDLARFAAFLAHPDPSVLAPATVEEMTVPRSGAPDSGRTVTYGLGSRLIVTADSRSLMGHTGSMPGFLAGLFVDRDHRMAALCLANTTDGMRCEGLPMDLLDIVHAAEPAFPEVWRPTERVPAEVAEILGPWYWGNTALQLRWDGRVLILGQPATGRSMQYRPSDSDTYVGLTGYHTGETLRVERRADGTVSHLECATFIYTRAPYDPGAPIPGGNPTG